MESNLMVASLKNKISRTILLTLSLAKLALANTYHVQFSPIWNLVSSMRSARVLIVHFITRKSM